MTIKGNFLYSGIQELATTVGTTLHSRENGGTIQHYRWFLRLETSKALSLGDIRKIWCVIAYGQRQGIRLSKNLRLYCPSTMTRHHCLLINMRHHCSLINIRYHRLSTVRFMSTTNLLLYSRLLMTILLKRTLPCQILDSITKRNQDCQRRCKDQ